MKRFLVVIALSLFAFSANSQVNPKALGLRFNGGYGSHYGGSGAELSYQHGMGSNNRLELDFGARGNNNWRHFGVSIIYHWVMNIDGGLNWYIGPGGQIGFYSHRNPVFGYEDGASIALGGQIGLEYDFKSAHGVPLLLSVDWRPMWDFIGDYRGFGFGSALSLRYVF